MTAPRSKPGTIRICFPFVGNSVGGSHISTLLLAENLDPREAEAVIVLHEEGPLSRYIDERGLRYDLIRIQQYCAPPYRSLRNILSILLNSVRIVRFIRRQRIDIVHVNDARIHYGWSLAAKLAGARLVWHQRQGVFGNSRFKKWLVSRADDVICITDYTVSTLPAAVKPRAKIVANPFEAPRGAVDRSLAKADMIHQLAFAPDTKLVGFFGNLSARKRPDFFLHIAAAVRRGIDQPVAFLLFGGDPNGKIGELSTLAAELGVSDSVRFMGFCSPVEPLIAGCDVLVAPAVREGLGRSVIEAMLLGTPVVAADTGGHKEILTDGETGLLVEAEDVDAFAAAICRLLQDPALASKIAERAKSETLCNFSVGRHISEMMQIFRECLDRARPTP